MKCDRCDDGVVERDRSYGDYMVAQAYTCDACKGTTVAKCYYCEKDADVDDGDYFCQACYDEMPLV